MRNYHLLILSYIFAGSLLTAPLAYAEKGHERMEKKIQEIYGQLNLTDAQKKQLEDNKSKHRDQMKETFAKMRSLKEALNAELMKSSLDVAKINQIQAQFKTMQADMVDRRLSSVLEVRNILTPEQFAKFIGLMEVRKREHEQLDDKD